MGWNDEHPSIFCVGSTSDKVSAPHQPLVFCLLVGVQVPALIDTGSMKSIISSQVFAHLVQASAHSKSPPPSLRSTSNTCVSITGQPLQFSGSISSSLSFPSNDFLYAGEFLGCDNVLPPLQCVLRWDFLTGNHLQLAVLGGTYSLVGPHGSTPIAALSSLLHSLPLRSHAPLLYPSKATCLFLYSLLTMVQFL